MEDYTEALAGSPPESGSSYADASSQHTEPGFVPSAEPQQDVNGGGQRQSDYVPYARFQEVNETLSALKQEAKDYGYDDPREYVQALRQAYEATQQQPASDYGTDPYGQQPAHDPELDVMKQAMAQMLFEKNFGALKEQFPLADQAEVWEAMTYGKFQGQNALQRAMQANHQRREQLKQQWLAEYQQTNQRRQAAAVEGGGGGVMSGGVDFSKMSREQFLAYQQKVLSREV